MKHSFYRFLPAALLLIFFSSNTFAQTGTIRGTVRDAAGVPLVGASVVLLGERTGTVTNANGEYTLNLRPGTYTVVYSYVSQASQRFSITVEEGQTLDRDVVLQEVVDLTGVVILGSRSRMPRSKLTTPAPVDVISAAELLSTGQVEPTQMINVIAPSFNSSRQTISDGTDHIDPATLRGLGPDQVLVLMNGKRRHNTALININGTLGRGSVGTDLNSIPASAIERLEVLRDGASSQYGSDAIGGVINVVLKRSKGTTVTTHVGQHYQGDGEVAQLGLNHGFEFRNNGFLNLSADLRYRGPTNRVGDYTGPVYVRWDNVTDINERMAKYNQDQQLIEQNNFDRRYNMQIGNSLLRNAGGMLNGGLSLGVKADIYFSAGVNYRQGEAAGFYRYPYQTTQVISEIYPNGFLPQIHSEIWDKSVQAGIKFRTGGWDWDVSNTYGGNSFRFDVFNSNNASQFALSKNAPTEFYSGKLKFNQNTFNVDLRQDFGNSLGLPSFNVAFGGEWRTDFYAIDEGEEASWKNYDPSSGKVGGAQVFPGFQPENAVDENRGVLGAYIDIESDVSNKLLLNAAARYEYYSDFGSNLAGKIAMRYKLNQMMAIRGALSNGFRAPSIHQRYFSTVSTQFVNVNGVLTPRQVGTFRNNSEVAMAFGIPALDAEKSWNGSLGVTLSAGARVSITIDGYFIRINDRIVYTSQFSRANPVVNSLLTNYPDVNAAQFFTNAVNTETKGLDIVATYRPEVGTGKLDLTLAGNFNRTYVVGEIKGTDKIPADDFGNVLFSRQERSRLEETQPKSKISFAAMYRRKKLGLNLRITRYGEVSTKDAANPALDEEFSAKIVTDANISYQLLSNLQVMIGANNLLNVYPDKMKQVNYPTPDSTGPFLDNSSFGRFIYSRNITQFGFNGGYYYLNLSLNF